MLMKLLYLFFVGSILGWILESIYRKLCKDNKAHKWINPGFGPYLPLYGFGLCTLFLLAEYGNTIHIENPIISKIVILLLMSVCMTVLELIAGLIFIQGMNLKLWDYSDKPFNYKGIICAEFSFYWFCLAALYYLTIHSFMTAFINEIIKEPRYLFVLGLICGIFIIDLCYSMQIATKIRKFADDNNILVRYEELKSNIRKYAEEHKEKYLFMFAFHSKVSLNEHLKNYLEKSPKIKKIKEKLRR